MYSHSECAPSASFHILMLQDVDYKLGLINSGFVCRTCRTGYVNDSRCANCSLCVAGTYSDTHNSCEMCPAGNCQNIDQSTHWQNMQTARKICLLSFLHTWCLSTALWTTPQNSAGYGHWSSKHPSTIWRPKAMFRPCTWVRALVFRKKSCVHVFVQRES